MDANLNSEAIQIDHIPASDAHADVYRVQGGKPGSAAAMQRPPVVPKHGAGTLRPFQKGDVGNPDGKGGAYRDIVALARSASPEAMQKLIALMSSKDERTALVAADKVLERAFGKVKEVAQPDGPVTEAGMDQRKKEVRLALMGLLEKMEDQVRESGGAVVGVVKPKDGQGV